MYVLMDLEWVTNSHVYFSPTQIGAMRVNDVWERQSAFYSRIRPRDKSFYQWNHMGYTGGTSLDFLHAPGIYQVLTNLEAWLLEDDVICRMVSVEPSMHQLASDLVEAANVHGGRDNISVVCIRI